MSNILSETVKKYLRCRPAKYQRFAVISDDSHVKYCVRNSLDKTKCIYATLLNIKGLSCEGMTIIVNRNRLLGNLLLYVFVSGSMLNST